MKILLVDDNLGHARFVAGVVAEAFPDATVHRAGRLETACRVLDSTFVDVVLLDLFLPDSQGPATVAAVVERAAGAAVVVVTALDDGAVEADAVAAGAAAVLAKDRLDAGRLREAVGSASARRGPGAPLLRDAFVAIGERYLGLAARHGLPSVLVLLWPAEGSAVSADEVGEAAARTFRLTDLCGRVSETHTAALLLDDRSGGEVALLRLERRLAEVAPGLPAEARTVEVATRRIDAGTLVAGLDHALAAMVRAASSGARPPRPLVLTCVGEGPAAALASLLGDRFDIEPARNPDDLLRRAALEEAAAIVLDAGAAGPDHELLGRLARAAESRRVPVLLAHDPAEAVDEVVVHRHGYAAALPLDQRAAGVVEEALRR